MPTVLKRRPKRKPRYLRICIPYTWRNTRITEFVNSKVPLSGNRIWVIRNSPDDDELQYRLPCTVHEDHVHITLTAKKKG